MKTFVTGGAGFIGSHLVRALEEQGHKVTVYDRVNGNDLLDEDRLLDRLQEHSIVYHLAANVDTRTGITNPDKDFKNGTLATFNLLEAMRLNNIRSLVYTSSATVYGDLASAVPVDEYVPPEPISTYGASKVACEALVDAYCHTFDFRASVYRLGNITGPGTKMGVVYDLVNKLKKNPEELEVLGDGKQRRGFLWVEDCIKVLLADKSEGTYNVGNTNVLSVDEVVSLVCEEMKVSPQVKYTGSRRGWRGDAPVVYLDTSKIRSTGWRPTKSSEESVRETVRWLCRT